MKHPHVGADGVNVSSRTVGREVHCPSCARVAIYLERAVSVVTGAEQYFILVDLTLPRVHLGHIPGSLNDFSHCRDIYPESALAFCEQV